MKSEPTPLLAVALLAFGCNASTPPKDRPPDRAAPHQAVSTADQALVESGMQRLDEIDRAYEQRFFQQEGTPVAKAGSYLRRASAILREIADQVPFSDPTRRARFRAQALQAADEIENESLRIVDLAGARRAYFLLASHMSGLQELISNR